MRSYLIAVPEALTGVSAALSAIGEALGEAAPAGPAPRAPAAAYEVSAAISRMFAAYGRIRSDQVRRTCSRTGLRVCTLRGLGLGIF
jgi:PE family